MTLLANGITGPLPIEDALGVAGMLVKTRRAVPANMWVPELARKADSESLERLI